jgi:protocatechuate 3,4-dioxygenase beta subunit
MTARPHLSAALLLISLAFASCGGDDSKGETTGAEAAEDVTLTTAARNCEATPAQTEGPYYKAGPPRRRSIAGPGVTGRPLVIKGRVLSTKCKAIKRARVDFWQADGNGEYDNAGYRLRGYQLTDGKGRYRVTTVVPGLYEGRTRHIHVKVTPPGGATLTTQLYFAGEAANQTDSIFTRETLLRLRRGPEAWHGSFDFAVSAR